MTAKIDQTNVDMTSNRQFHKTEKRFLLSLVNLLLILFISFLPSKISSQPVNVRFKYITVKDGLPTPNIERIVEDSRGFMWFGTDDGLIRYDGYSFKVFKNIEGNPNTISADYVRAMAATPDGNLWLGVLNGINYYDYSKDKFTHYAYSADGKTESAQNDVFSLALEGNGDLWFTVTDGGLNHFDAKAKKITRYMNDKNDPNSISNNNAMAVCLDRQGRVWVGTTEGLLELFNKKTHKFTHYQIFDRKKGFLNVSRIKDIFQDKKGDFWITTSGSGLFKMEEPEDGKFLFTNYSYDPLDQTSISNNSTNRITEDQKGGYWIGTENGGLNYLDANEKTFTRFMSSDVKDGSINGNSVWSLCQDKSGNLWVGVFNKGIDVNITSFSRFKNYKKIACDDASLSYNTVSTFCEDHLGDMWIGTDGAGVNLFDRNTETFTHYNSSNSNLGGDAVLAIYEDKNNNLWVGTWQGGLNLFNRQTGRFTNYTKANSGLSCDNIISIMEDKRGVLWVGSFMCDGGINYFDEKQNRFFAYTKENSGLCNNTIYAMVNGPKGTILIGTLSGFSVFNPSDKKFTNYYNSADTTSLSNNTITAILCAHDSTVWIGTSKGLSRFDPVKKTFRQYYIKEGLPSNYIAGIEEDENGNIWLGTGNGISKYNPATNKFVNYDASDGLQGSQFYRCSHYKDHNGDLYFGGTNGFNFFTPSKITEEKVKPKLFLTDFKIFFKPVPVGVKGSPLQVSISETKRLKLSYKYSTITFEFIALYYNAPNKVMYAYKMEGFDKDWNYVNNEHSATYTNLNPGKYVFRVKVPENNGVANEEGISIQVVIVPPFWKTWWFYTLVISFVVYLIYFLAKKRLEQLNHDKQILEKKLKEGEEVIQQKIKQVEKQGEVIKERDRREVEIRFINNGIALFSEIISNLSGDMKKMLSKTTSELVEYVGATMGTIFVAQRDSENNVLLQMEAAYGMNRNSEHNEFKAGEGFVGTCFVENKTIYIDNLPPTYAKLTSGLGETTLAHLYLVPLRYTDSIQGVMEIFSIQPLEEYKIRFTEKIAENISAFIAITKANEYTKVLLGIADRHTSELQAQEEELRQNLEEIEATREETERKEMVISKQINNFTENEKKLKDNIKSLERKIQELSEAKPVTK